MPTRPDDHLHALAARIDTDPGFVFLRSLAAEHPTSDAYVVGGIVRDALLGREATDYDLVIRGVPARELEAFLCTHGRVDLVGRTFGVLKFRPQGWPANVEEIDIALPRREHAEGSGGYRDFDVQADPQLSIDDDLSRRDFTVNAMAWDLHRRRLVDPFGGQADLAARMIRAVGDPRERFTEDRSRMLRGLRLACQLGFAIDDATQQAIRVLMPRINEARDTTSGVQEFITPRETVARELLKSFTGDPVRSLDLWDDAGALAILIPELLPMKGCAQPHAYHSEGDVWEHTRRALGVLTSPEYRSEFGDALPDGLTRLNFSEQNLGGLVTMGVLFHDVGKPSTQKTPERDHTDRIRFDGHDVAGGRMARDIAQRLTFAAPFPRSDTRHVDPEDLGWIIDHHLLLLEDPSIMRAATLERYFFRSERPGEALQRVMFCDGTASIPDGSPHADLAHFRVLQQRLRDLVAIAEERDRLPRAMLNGEEIMARFDLRPGPHLRPLIEALREEQLRRLQAGTPMTRDEAYAFLAPHIRPLRPLTDPPK